MVLKKKEKLKTMIFGDKTSAIFDIWSVEHLLTGIILAFILAKLLPNKKSIFLLLLLVSCFWECLEHYLEEGLMGQKIQTWFAGTEYWGNRLFGDNLMIILGYVLYRKYPKTAYIAFVLVGIFLTIHLMFPSSMDLQKIITQSL